MSQNANCLSSNALETLDDVVSGQTGLSSAGFPFIGELEFKAFNRNVPILFAHGQAGLDWIEAQEEQLPASEEDAVSPEELSRLRALKVLKRVILTSAVTAPSDLWLLRWILHYHAALGIRDHILEAETFTSAEIAEKTGFAEKQLDLDFRFFHSRGLLDHENERFRIPDDNAVRATFSQVRPLPENLRTNLTQTLVDTLSGKPIDIDLGVLFHVEPAKSRPHWSWVPTLADIENGFRVLPLVLAVNSTLATRSFRETRVPQGLAEQKEIMGFLATIGCAKDGALTKLGARLFRRGPGPLGIVGAYYPYMLNLEHFYKNEGHKAWVSRGENVAASQDANKKTFLAANDALDRFSKETGFTFNVFIEHAVGKGEATRQRFERMDDGLQYYGADLEDAAIEEAKKQQEKGILPKNMAFIRGADIGEPSLVVDFLKNREVETQGAVMMVGNGFHEIRNQTNEKMLQVFQGYADAGILLIFTEETALSDKDLRNTAWNTYHAGFRYVHDLSGQGLRPSQTDQNLQGLWSWRKCAEKAGYRVIDRYTVGTRTIYPYRKPGKKNPSISVTYFCVPRTICDGLEIPCSGKQHG